MCHSVLVVFNGASCTLTVICKHCWPYITPLPWTSVTLTMPRCAIVYSGTYGSCSGLCMEHSRMRSICIYTLTYWCRCCAAAGRAGPDPVQRTIHRCTALQPGPAAPVCRRLSGMSRLCSRGGPVSEQRMGWHGCTGEVLCAVLRFISTALNCVILSNETFQIPLST